MSCLFIICRHSDLIASISVREALQVKVLDKLFSSAKAAGVHFGFCQATREADITIHSLLATGHFQVVRSCDSGEKARAA